MDPRDDISTVCATPRTYRLDGVDYPVAKLRPRDLGELQSWLKSRVPDPRERAAKLIEKCQFEGLATKVWEAAEEEAKSWPPKFGDQRAEQELATTEGVTQLLYLVLRRTVPNFDPAAAARLADRIELDDLRRIVALAAPEGLADPKATTATTTTA